MANLLKITANIFKIIDLKREFILHFLIDRGLSFQPKRKICRHIPSSNRLSAGEPTDFYKTNSQAKKDAAMLTVLN